MFSMNSTRREPLGRTIDINLKPFRFADYADPSQEDDRIYGARCNPA
jgi:hypothetical protein